MPLTDTECRNAKPGASVRKLSDGGGLQLWLMPSGGKLWRLAYRAGPKQKLLSLGAYPLLTLAAARSARDEHKRSILAGLDPGEIRKAAKVAKAAAGDTFGKIAGEYLEKLRKDGLAEATLSKNAWLLSFATSLDQRVIRDISPADLLAVLRQVEGRGRRETARRLRATVGSVFRYAIATARAENDPTYALRGALLAPVVRSRAAVIEPKAFGGLLRAVRSYEGQPVVRLCLELLAVLYSRPGELRWAEWTEFDVGKRIWVIPPSRMKMRRPHAVPLPDQALALLAELRALTGHGRYLFPSLRSADRPISENTTNAALRRLGFSKDEATSHGFRSSASSLLHETGLWPSDVIEKSLAHEDANKVRGIYSRGIYWEQRVSMAQAWADSIDRMRSDIDHEAVGKV